MLYHEYKTPESVCAGKLFWIWGCYAILMSWLWNGLIAAGLPAAAIWGIAGLAGGCLLLATWEI